MSTTPKIELIDVHMRFGDKVVLDGVDLVVEAGESMGVSGGSGVGKSVTLKIVLGLLTPTSGRVLVDGQDVTRISGREREAVNRKFGMLFQGAALFDSLSVWQNVAFSLIQGQGVEHEAARKIAFEKLAAVGLGDDVAALYPDELSGGMKKRVALARAIAAEPEIIFFDEPTTGLDPIMADVIDALIVKCVRDLGATALSITHDMISARRIADRVAMLHKGKIIWTGPIADIDDSGNAFVDQFVNGSAEGPIQMEVRAL